MQYHTCVRMAAWASAVGLCASASSSTWRQASLDTSQALGASIAAPSCANSCRTAQWRLCPLVRSAADASIANPADFCVQYEQVLSIQRI